MPSKIMSKAFLLMWLTMNTVVHYLETSAHMKSCSIPVSVQNLEREKQERQNKQDLDVEIGADFDGCIANNATHA